VRDCERDRARPKRKEVSRHAGKERGDGRMKVERPERAGSRDERRFRNRDCARATRERRKKRVVTERGGADVQGARG